MAGAGRGDALVLFRVSCFDGKCVFPVFPIVVGDQQRDGGTDCLTMAHAGEETSRIFLYAHAATASIPLLPAPEFPLDEGEVDRKSGRYPGEDGDQGFSVTLARGTET